MGNNHYESLVYGQPEPYMYVKKIFFPTIYLSFDYLMVTRR